MDISELDGSLDLDNYVINFSLKNMKSLSAKCCVILSGRARAAHASRRLCSCRKCLASNFSYDPP